jgi:hypothetical protein
VTTSGRAIQANSSTTSNGGKGGQITVLASGTIAFGTAFIQAARRHFTGGARRGGRYHLAHSFNAKVTGAAPGQLNATGPGGHGHPRGLREVVGDYTGTVIGTRVTDPTHRRHAAVAEPANAASGGQLSDRCRVIIGNKSGRKFNDLNKNGVDDGEPGLVGWEIRVSRHCDHDPGRHDDSPRSTAATPCPATRQLHGLRSAAARLDQSAPSRRRPTRHLYRHADSSR